MHRITATLGSVIAAALLSLAVPGPADAATGWISINGFTYSNPHGCYSPGHGNLTIVNHTDTKAVVYTGEHCRGGVDQTIEPGKSIYTNKGRSVHIR
ncbi:hypothetical protein [Nocardia pseudobrasiliensis]|uniref:Secreted protein n=1 Tax=Nocardia pseudobrasiliensis TaxID=45979 RepID=A0A370HQI4_9NOCA|nr:hypothetical protein [Nocardia pseudobrasiliensis]RDI60560.1 hypothetical protein DFR76_115190 [Nocardia pseudobrasiliensis]